MATFATTSRPRAFRKARSRCPRGALRLPLLLKKRATRSAASANGGWDRVGSTGDPLKQGFDRWFGYNCQAVAHNYYPTHLWDNDKQIKLRQPEVRRSPEACRAGADPNDPASYAGFTGKEYAPTHRREGARVRPGEQGPSVLPVLSRPRCRTWRLQVPEDSLDEYAGKFPETPYTGGRGYLPHRQPRAAYAAMITRMDRDVGKLLALVKELDLDRADDRRLHQRQRPALRSIGRHRHRVLQQQRRPARARRARSTKAASASRAWSAGRDASRRGAQPIA